MKQGPIPVLVFLSIVCAQATARPVKVRNAVNAFDFMTPDQIADVRAGTGAIDVGAALQKALLAGAGKTTIIPEGTYKSTIGLKIHGSVRCEGATIKFHGMTIQHLVSQSVDGSVRGCTIDGANVKSVENGLFVNTDFVQAGTAYYDLKIRSIASGDSSKGVNGALFYKASNATLNANTRLDIKLDVEDISATANGKIGDTGGSSTGILISFNGAGTNADVVVRDTVVKNVLPVEDSGGIQFYVGDHNVAGARGRYVIRNANIYNAKKRGIKVQSPNTTVRDTTVFGQDTTIGFDTYGVNTVFVNDRYILGNSTGFRTSGAATRISHSTAETHTQQPTLRLENGASDVVVSDSTFVNSASMSSPANAIVQVNGVANSTFDHVTISNTRNTGSGISVAGACDIAFLNGSIRNTENGVYLPYSTGNFSLVNSSVNVAQNGFARLGKTAQTATVKHSTIAAAIGMNLTGNGISATADVSDSVINASMHGILAGSGSRIVHTEITSTETTGVGISAGNSIARGNRISKFGVGISYTSTTSADVSDNLTIGTKKPYETTGTKAVVNDNNQSR
jgi:hypothetical protein